MPCNCGGSTPRNTEPRELRRPATAVRRGDQTPRPRRTGGPGEPGYYFSGPPKAAGPREWNGPKRARPAE